MTRRHGILAMVAFLLMGLGFAFPHGARGQEVIRYGGSVVHSAPLYYDRVYQGSAWEWSPQLGYYRHDYYTCVPRWTPNYILSIPTTPTSQKPILLVGPVYPW
jgi:hypothetical protein